MIKQTEDREDDWFIECDNCRLASYQFSHMETKKEAVEGYAGAGWVLDEGNQKSFCPTCVSNEALPAGWQSTPLIDPVTNPPHYRMGKIEPIDVIEDWALGFCTGNALKYIARAKHKGSELEDLKKAAWYLAREVKRLEGG